MLAEILVDIPLPEDPRLGLGLVELGALRQRWKSWSSTACSARAKSLPSCFLPLANSASTPAMQPTPAQSKASPSPTHPPPRR